jgi:AcrR family transcriptional regulator
MRARNERLGITGRLYHFGHYLVHVIEGEAKDLRAFSNLATAGPAVQPVIGLIDNIVVDRVFPDWSVEFVGDRSAQRIALTRDRGEASPPAPDEAREAAAWRVLAVRDAARRELKRQPLRRLRVAPRQARAEKTVERLLDSVTRLLGAATSVERVTFEAVAVGANVTQQSAYRYFANVDDVVRAAVRRMQAGWYARLLDHLGRGPVSGEAALAAAVADYVADQHWTQLDVPPRLRLRILRDYHELGFEAADTVAGAMAGLLPSGEAPATPRLRQCLAAGLTALLAVAKSLALCDPAGLSVPASRQMMVDIFLAALSSPAASAARHFSPLL